MLTLALLFAGAAQAATHRVYVGDAWSHVGEAMTLVAVDEDGNFGITPSDDCSDYSFPILYNYVWAVDLGYDGLASIQYESVSCTFLDSSSTVDMMYILQFYETEMTGKGSYSHTTWGDISGRTSGDAGEPEVVDLGVTGPVPYNSDHYYQMGVNLYPSDGVCTEDLVMSHCDLEYSITAQTIELDDGWNIISLNMEPADLDPAEVFAEELVDEFDVDTEGSSTNLWIMKNGDGAIFWPDWSFNGIGDMTLGQGYQVKMINETVLEIEGTVADPTTPIEILSGWSMIGYLPKGEMDPYDALESLYVDGDISHIFMKDSGAYFFWPEFGFSNLTMTPGQGYQLKNGLEDAQTLTYPYVEAWED
jgi:hypothetical protein